VYAVVDIEATGGNHIKGKIIEIAIIIYDGKKITKEYSTLVNPETKIDWYVTKLTKITNDMVATAPLFKDVAAEIVELIQGNIFVAHDVDFDYKFLKAELKNAGFDINEPKVCTIKLSEKHLPDASSYSLGKLCDEMGIPIPTEVRHRAAGDAVATANLLGLLLASED